VSIVKYSCDTQSEAGIVKFNARQFRHRNDQWKPPKAARLLAST